MEKPIIGMVHLWPLPGAPGYDLYGMEAVIEHALQDAKALFEGGVDGIIVENVWDLPYCVGRDVPPEEMTAQAVAAREVVRAANVPVGVNVAHNGGQVTLSTPWLLAPTSFASVYSPGRGSGTRGNSTTAAPPNSSACGKAWGQNTSGSSPMWTRSTRCLPRHRPGHPHRVDRVLLGRCPHRLRQDDGRRTRH